MQSEITHLLRDADPAFARVLDAIERRELTPATHDDLVRWAHYLRITRGYSFRTVETYAVNVAAFLLWRQTQGTEAAKPVTFDEGEIWLRHLYLVRRNGNTTRGLRLTAVRQYLDWRERLGLGVNGLRTLPGPRRTQRSPQKFTSGELKKLFATPDRGTPIGSRDFAVLAMLYATGARRQEMVDLNLDQLSLRDRVGAVRFMGKGSKERVVTFEGRILQALREWLAVRDGLGAAVDPDAVWVSMHGHRGRRLTAKGLMQILHRVGARAGLQRETLWLHKFRSTFATDLYDQQTDLEVIRALMGHSKLDTTRQYLAISERRLRARLPAARLDDMLGLSNVSPMPRWFQAQQQRRVRWPGDS